MSDIEIPLINHRLRMNFLLNRHLFMFNRHRFIDQNNSISHRDLSAPSSLCTEADRIEPNMSLVQFERIERNLRGVRRMTTDAAMM